MSQVQKTPIVDKNGKHTTVNKRVDSASGNSRVANVSAQPVNFHDDPNDTFFEATDRMTRGAQALASLISINADEENFGEVARISRKLAGVADARAEWEKIAARSGSLNDAKTKFLDTYDKIAGNAEYAGWNLVADYIRSTEPMSINRLNS